MQNSFFTKEHDALTKVISPGTGGRSLAGCLRMPGTAATVYLDKSAGIDIILHVYKTPNSDQELFVQG
jgi:hypothetical protein